MDSWRRTLEAAGFRVVGDAPPKHEEPLSDEDEQWSWVMESFYGAPYYTYAEGSD